MRHVFYRIGIIFALLITMGATSVSASNAHHCLIGDPITTWKTTDNWSKNYEEFALTSPANTNWDEFCIYMWVETNQIFAFNNHFFNPGEAKQVGPSSDQATINKDGGTGVGVATDGTTNAWKYTGATGLVKICAAQSSGGNGQGEWKPYVWVEESKEIEILKGNKIMFYFGMTTSWNENWNVLRTSNTSEKTADQQYHRLPESKCSSWISVAYVSPAQYYVGKTEWAGVQMESTAEAGCLYSVYNDNDDGDKIYKNVADGAIPHFATTTVNKTVGTVDSEIAATANKSIYGNEQVLYYYYTTDGGTTFTKFDPSDISSLAVGVYTIYALGWDGHILVRSDNTVTLNVGVTISLDANGGTDGDVTSVFATSGIAASTGNIAAASLPTKTGYTFNGFCTSGGTEVIDKNGEWKTDVSGYTDNSGNWICSAASTLYAKWTEQEYTISIKVDGLGATEPVSQIYAKYTTASDEITATASTGYSFSQWDFSKQGERDYDVWCAAGSTSTNATIRILAKRDGTLTAKFTANNYNVNLENLDADEGYKGTENVSVTYNSSVNLTEKITIPQKAHYDFGGYYTGYDELNEDVTGVQVINADGEWRASVEGYTDGDKNWLYTDSLTLYAKWTEHPYKIALVVAPEGAGTIDKGDTIAAYYVKPTDLITATPANPAWKFKEWKYSENVGPANGTGKDNTVQINATKAGTLTANFEERYSIKGTMNGENWGTTHTLSNIGTNAGSKDTCYVTMTLPANTTYEFAIYDEQTKGWLKNSTTEVFKMTYGNSSAWPFDTDKTVNCGITTAGKGTYKFIFNITDKTVTVVYPTSYQVNYGASPSVGGNITVVDDDSQAVPNGGYVRSGGSVTYTAAAASGYTFVGWCGSDEYGETFNTELSRTHSSVAATSNSYAKFKSTNFVIYRSGDMSSDPRAAYDDVESYAGGTISQAIEFRMRVNRLDYWYTLCLPFTVTAVKVWDEEDGQYYDIVPYWRTGGTYYTGHYILRKPVTTTNFAIEGFEGKDRWIDPESSDVLPSKNIPYIIQWHDPYFQDMYISFFGTAGQIIPTAMDKGSYASSDETVNIYGNNSMTTGTVRDAYLLDPYYGPDGAWMREEIGTDRSVLPFECFILANPTTTAKYRVLRRDMADDTPTGLDTLFKKEDTVSKVLINNRIYIIRGGKMYTIQGTFVKKVE